VILSPGWDVTVVTDASGAVSVEAHEVAIQRMIAAGASMMTWLAVAAEWQRDWARAESAAKLTEVIVQHPAAAASPSRRSSSCSTRLCQTAKADLSLGWRLSNEASQEVDGSSSIAVPIRPLARLVEGQCVLRQDS
jgi:hypothetical protein